MIGGLVLEEPEFYEREESEIDNSFDPPYPSLDDLIEEEEMERDLQERADFLDQQAHLEDEGVPYGREYLVESGQNGIESEYDDDESY